MTDSLIKGDISRACKVPDAKGRQATTFRGKHRSIGTLKRCIPERSQRMCNLSKRMWFTIRVEEGEAGQTG